MSSGPKFRLRSLAGAAGGEPHEIIVFANLQRATRVLPLKLAPTVGTYT